MKNKEIAQYGLGSFILFWVTSASGGAEGEGIVAVLFYLSCIAYIVFTIWGVVRLFKSKE